MPSEKRKFGDFGEKRAEEYLKSNGYKVIGRNYRVKNIGEIDLIAMKDKKLIFFEVKTRSAGYEMSFPIEFSINKKKIRNLRRICHIYLTGNRYPTSMEWQVDSLFLLVDADGRFRVNHLENILWEEYY